MSINIILASTMCAFSLASDSISDSEPAGRHRLIDYVTTDAPEVIPMSPPTDPIIVNPNTLPPWPVPSETVLRVSAGNHHTCVLWQDYGIKCFGHAHYGALGYGDQFPRGGEENTMGEFLPFVSMGSGDFIPKSVQAGDGVTCALSGEKEVRCWGKRTAGQETSDLTLSPQHVDFGDEFENGIGAMYYGTSGGAIVSEDKQTIKMFGANYRGQIGYDRVGAVNDWYWVGDQPGEMSNNLQTLDLGSHMEILQVAIGNFHSCAIMRKLRKNNPRNRKRTLLKCWGNNGFGNLGLGDFEARTGSDMMGDKLKAVKLGRDFHPIQVSVGEGFTVVVSDDGRVKVFGSNRNGQLGLEDSVTTIGHRKRQMGRNLPSIDLGDDFYVVFAEAGRDHVCALSDDSRIKCWGDNFFGQLGLGDNQDRGAAPGDMGENLPEVDLGEEFVPVQLSVGQTHNCAVSIDNQIKCWGSNGLGELGLEDRISRGEVPSDMGDDLDVIDVFDLD